ncbi:MAG: tRNA (adenosine(37)-N6)-threonylcarbamoyltransferase complex ATPase subunit type 1 TsaE [Patescibacteria group bacterium]|nr:tRNA (adenosine(37)-N6)-threonylcarbamoyltransferase complex ATPase subunit type 1 TsaE [Patescibacteria group bacterium]
MTKNQPVTELISKSVEETKNIARNLILRNSAYPICLYGDLGTGKTIFAKGAADELGIDGEKIKSPTFNFVREYTLVNGTFSHCDLYRLDEIDEILAEQLEEAYEKGPVIIEWAEKAEKVLPFIRTDVFFEYIDENKRLIKIHGR